MECTNDSIKTALTTIRRLIETAQRILINTSDPVDPDCVGTALALRWLLQQKKKQADIVSFSRIPPSMSEFPDIEHVRAAETAGFDFSPYDLLILVDGSSWAQFWGNKWQSVLGKIDTERIVHFDHHQPEEMYAGISERSLTVQTSSTVQLIYDYLIKPDAGFVPPHVAHYLYLGLLYDARYFKNEIYPGEYRFAEELLACGADHDRAVDTNHEMPEYWFLAWAIEHTEMIPELALTLLVIDARQNRELAERFGEHWKDFDTLYKGTFQRQVRGYNYGIILTDNLDGTIRFNWRTRSYGRHLSIADIARAAGFRAGGHRNAGGGIFEGTIHDARKRLLDELSKATKQPPPRSSR